MSSGTRGLWSSEDEQRLGMAEKGSIDCTAIRTAAQRKGPVKGVFRIEVGKAKPDPPF